MKFGVSTILGIVSIVFFLLYAFGVEVVLGAKTLGLAGGFLAAAMVFA